VTGTLNHKHATVVLDGVSFAFHLCLNVSVTGCCHSLFKTVSPFCWWNVCLMSMLLWVTYILRCLS